jgi:hypothetical protein
MITSLTDMYVTLIMLRHTIYILLVYGIEVTKKHVQNKTCNMFDIAKLFVAWFWFIIVAVYHDGCLTHEDLTTPSPAAILAQTEV